jgi:hypothetical protein
MKMLSTALGVSSFLALMVGSATVPGVATADAAEQSYVACNQFGDCWRVHRRYAYGEAAPITYYNADWYETHRNDANIHWRDDPRDDRGYYERGGEWHADPAARAVKVGATGAGIGAAIGCLVTLPIGCAPGAAAGAAIGGGTGAVAGAASAHN